MAEIQANARPPLYVPQGRPMTRTRNPIRPHWLDEIKRPIRIVALNQTDLNDFEKSWRLDACELLRILLVGDLSKLAFTHPLLVMPGAEDESMIHDFCPVRYWRERGGPVITIPDCAVRRERAMDNSAWVQPHFPIETNMAAETIIAIALHRHLDGLNSR